MADSFYYRYIVFFVIINTGTFTGTHIFGEHMDGPNFFNSTVYSERIKDMIYMPLDGVAACFRRHNGTNQFGCSCEFSINPLNERHITYYHRPLFPKFTKVFKHNNYQSNKNVLPASRSGNVGVIHIVGNEEELSWLIKNGTAGPYAAVVPMSMFTRNTLIRLRDAGHVNGVLLTRNITLPRPSSYSPDDTCPNRYSGLKRCDDAKPWNPHGSSLFLEDWPFPMFYLENEKQMADINSCFAKFNAEDRETQNQRSLCALEMKSFMLSAVDSETCMRRSVPGLNFNPPLFCDPMGDRNILWPVKPLTENTESVIMIIARLDASSLFDGLAPGAGSAITGLVTLIATAYYLNKMNPTVDKLNVVFSLLNGEAFDYIGSSRLVYDLKEGKLNSLGGKTLKLDQVKMVIELGQLGNGEVYLHANNSENDQIIKSLQQNLSAEVIHGSIPPTSVQSFLLVNPNLSATVIANYKTEFVNQYYHSILDDAESVKFDRNDTRLASSLNRIALSLANQLFFNVTGTNPPLIDPVEVETLILSMLTCYLEDPQCLLFQAASSPSAKLPNILTLYVGVNRWMNPATTLTGQLLALLTGKELPEYNSTTCNENHYAWMKGFNSSGICINSTVNFSSAASPAFIIDGYNMKSGLYPTWTESVWQELNMRLFLKPSPAIEHLSIVLGSIVTIISFIIVWFIKSRTDVLFEPIETADC